MFSKVFSGEIKIESPCVKLLFCWAIEFGIRRKNWTENWAESSIRKKSVRDGSSNLTFLRFKAVSQVQQFEIEHLKAIMASEQGTGSEENLDFLNGRLE